MGFLKSLFGGSDSKSTQSSSSGYSTVPGAIRAGFDELGKSVSQYTNPNDPANIARFTPLAETGDESSAYNTIRGGFTPTPETLGADLSMLMNPYNEYVIGGINNAAAGDYSILKQALNEAGQFGSNRQVLGANDIELQRQNQIGSMLQGQYNQALEQIFNNLVPQRQQDASNLMGIADRQRTIDAQTKLAPIAALQAGTGMIAPFTGATSTGYSMTNDYGKGIIPGIGQAAGGVGTAMMAMSDITLKENITLLGKENGHNIYEFSYKGSPRRFRGVMAQEVQKINPNAVINTPSGLAVDYGRIGVEFKEVSNG